MRYILLSLFLLPILLFGQADQSNIPIWKSSTKETNINSVSSPKTPLFGLKDSTAGKGSITTFKTPRIKFPRLSGVNSGTVTGNVLWLLGDSLQSSPKSYLRFIPFEGTDSLSGNIFRTGNGESYFGTRNSGNVSWLDTYVDDSVRILEVLTNTSANSYSGTFMRSATDYARWDAWINGTVGNKRFWFDFTQPFKFEGSLIQGDSVYKTNDSLRYIQLGDANERYAPINILDSLNDLTVSTGLSLNSGTTYNGSVAKTITNDLSTGISGGQTIIGSTSTNSGLTIKATTGIGSTGANIIFQVGNNGATEALRILNSGNVGIGVASPTTGRLQISAGSASVAGIQLTNQTAYTGAIAGSVTLENTNDIIHIGNILAKRGTDANIGTSDNFGVNIVCGNVTRLGIANGGTVTFSNAIVGISNQSVFNTVSTQINAFGAATNITIGATTGQIVFRNASFELLGAIKGTSSQEVFNTLSTTVSAFGAATTLGIGGTSTANLTHNYSANATASGNTKTVNIGTAGVSGSTTNINLGSAVSGSTSNINVNGNIKLADAGDKLFIKSGTNATIGTATLVAGTATVNTTAVTASSAIFVTILTKGTIVLPVAYDASTRTAGTSFTITSADVTDTSAVQWWIVEPN